MRQFDVKSQKEINGNRFYIRPLPAFKCANLSGELASLIVPVLTSVAPLIGSNADIGSVMDMQAEKIAPHLAGGLSALSGDRVEALLKKLLTTYRNVAVEIEGGKDAQDLTDDLADEVFCGEVQDMFILAVEVIKVNFSGFFKKLGPLFGGRLAEILDKM